MTVGTDILRGGPIETRGIVSTLRNERSSLVPFDKRVVDFTSDLARRLRRQPEIQSSPALSALAFWIRPATIDRIRRDWFELVKIQPSVVRVPRGVVFHLPPTNVDTLFVYSWLLSALCGNANVIRLSPRSLEASRVLLDVVRDVLGDHQVMAETTTIVSYGHDEAITAALSTADVRVIWGGDEAVAAIRSVPCAPYTRDLAFPDRYSMTALGSAPVAEASEAELANLARSLFNDAYWFDQLGCASPRLIVWVGDEDTTRVASTRLTGALRDHLAERAHVAPPTSAVIAKLIHVADAASRDLVATVDRVDNAVTLATMKRIDCVERDAPGGGLFYAMRVDHLADLAPSIERRDQTLGVHALDATAIDEFVTAVGARGIDRIVPVGQALHFDRYWDGVDLLVEFTRLVALPSNA